MRLSEAEARARLDAARTATLATAGDDGRPHVVPITFAVEDDLIFTAVDHKPKSTRKLRRLRNIAQNPRVALLADEYSEDWNRLWWVRVDGLAEVIEDAEGMRHPVDALVRRYAQYREHRPEGPVIVIRVHSWSGWASS
jgi:PPOX class probable F420-dependent enzyme